MMYRLALVLGLLLVLVSDAWAPQGHGIYRPFPVPPAAGGGGLIMPAYDNVSANWTKAGLAVIGGIPTRNTVCATVNPSGVTPPSTVPADDATNINNAIAGCATGQVVLLGSGTFQLDTGEQITLNQSITLRGTGTCNNSSFPYCSSVIQYYNGGWPTYNATECGTTTGVPPSGTPPSSFVACPNGGKELVLVGPPFPPNFLGWGATSGATNCQAGNAVSSTVPCGTALAADVSQGATTVQVADNSNFSVGDWVLIDDYPTYTTQTNPLFAQFVSGGVGPPSTTVSATPDEFSSSPTPVTPHTENADVGDCDGYSMCNGRFNEEIHLVSAVGAGPCPGANCTLTFDSPLTMDKRHSNSHDGRVYWLTGCGCGSGPSPPTRVAFLAQAGLENVSLARGPASNLHFIFCAYCWTKNVDSGYWINGVNIDYSARTLFESSFFHNCVDCQNNGNEYPIGINTASTEILVENNIMLFGGKGMVGRVAAGSVVAYNYADKHFYEQGGVIGNYLLDMDINGSHEGGTHHFLMEGNWTSSCDGDNTHGAAAYHTFFRNDCNGFRTDFIDPSNTSLHVSDVNNTCWASGGVPNGCGRFRGAGPMSYNYWYAYVGNVMGLAGQSTTANGWIYSADTPGNRGTGSDHGMTDRAIWQSGWTGQDPGNCCNYVSDPNLDGTNNPPWIFRNGNYDYVTASVADNAAGYSNSLPNSLYLSSKPAFFNAGSCTYPWPWITPTSSPFVQPNTGGAGCGGSGLPAKARWDAGTPFVQP